LSVLEHDDPAIAPTDRNFSIIGVVAAPKFLPIAAAASFGVKKPAAAQRVDARMLDSRLRKKSVFNFRDVPQGLKPNVISVSYGTTEVVP
jgi:hypothetical protein